MNLNELDHLLDQVPLVVQGLHPVSLTFLGKPVKVYPTLEELAWVLDTPQVVSPHRALSFDTNAKYISRFLTVTVEHDPFTPALNNVLFERYEMIAASMLNHAQIADRIVAAARNAKTVILVLLDGLSYADCKDWPKVEPCLAAAPTITRIGFPTIIGTPPLAIRLFEVGLIRRAGFTYWERQDEPLSRRLFYTIENTRRLDPSHPDAFGQVVDWLSSQDLENTYVQVVRSALDEYAEGHRTSIPRQAVVQQIRRDLEAVADVLEHKGGPSILFAVADHGILWKDEGHNVEIIGLPGTRYIKGRGGPGRGRLFEVEGQPYWVLDYPQMGRPWKSREQGVHGGISFQESIVPFIQWEINLPC